jgi:sugar lactone lactonase YvrE
MATTSFNALRRISGIVFTLLLLGVCLCERSAGQQGASPLVTSSAAYALPVPPTYGAVWQSAVSSHGDFLIADFEDAAIYQYPAGGGAPITLFAAGTSGPGGMWANIGVALDQFDNLYLDNNWNGGMQRIPYDPVHKTWNVSADVTSNPIGPISGYFQGAGLAANANGLFVMSSECCSPSILSWNLDASGNVTNLQTVINSATSRARALAVDNAGNIFIWEDGGIPHVLEVPAGTTGLANDQSLAYVDPTTIDPTSGKVVPLLSSITGMTVDAAGNLYVGDSGDGVFMVPNQGGTLNPAAWVMITPAPAQAQISLDKAGDTLYIPTSSLWNGFKDVVAIGLGNAELGSSPVGTPGTPVTVYYSFSQAGPITPARFIIQEEGVSTPDFTVANSGATACVTGTTYPVPLSSTSSAVNNCTVTVTVNPHTVGSVSGQLLMQTSATVNKQTVYTTVATTALHGTGLAGAIEATPAWESAIGGSLKTPSQVTTDVMGNVYVADAGLGKVLMYAAGSGTSATGVSVGTGLTAPTGVAVDGSGDVFIADSGSVFEVPYGPGGLNAAGQMTLASGLGANLNLAADGLGHLYVADPANARVVELSNLGGALGAFGQSEVFLTSGFTAPSAVAVDASNNLYVIDGSNLFERSGGSLTTLVNTLSGATGVAVDPSGAVYVSSSGGTWRIPYVSGALNTAGQAAIATAVTNPLALAIDNMGNVYLADGTAKNLHTVSASASLNFGTVPLGNQPSLDVTVTNDGNAPLTITGYTSTNAVDFTGADGTCISGSPVAPAATCQVDVTLAPGPGEQGALTGQIGITSNAANAPIVVNATGVGAPLAVSVVSGISVASTAQVISTPVTVTVTPKSGTVVPTGSVTISVNGTKMGTGNLSNGSYTFTLAPVPAGTDTFAVSYSGDRVYGRSTGTINAPVAKSAVSAIKLPSSPAAPTYVLEADGSTPYDGSADYWEYNFKVQVTTAAGIPTGSVTFMDTYQAGSSSTTTSGIACPAQSGAAVQPVDPTGSASFATDCLPMPQNLTYTPVVSTHVITPVYSGDANYLTFTGQPTTFIVVRSPVVAITSVPASLSLSAGSSASAKLTLTSMLGYGFAGKNQQLNDYNFPLSLACSNLPPHATCSFSYTPDPALAAFGISATNPNAVNIPCAGTTAAADNCSPGSVTVTINTNAPVGTTTTTSQLAQPAPITFAAMFGFGMIGLFFRRKAGQKGRLLLMLCLIIVSGVFAGSLTACSTVNLSPASVLTTPSGTYAVTVTAQQVGTQAITLPTGPVTIYGSQNQVSLPFAINVTVQ